MMDRTTQVQEIIDQLRDNGVVERGWLGVQLQGLDKALAMSMGLDSTNGALGDKGLVCPK